MPLKTARLEAAPKISSNVHRHPLPVSASSHSTMPNIWPPSADRDPDHPDSTILDQASSTAPVYLPDDAKLEVQFGLEVNTVAPRHPLLILLTV